MKSKLLASFLLIVLVACQNKNQISFETLNFSNEEATNTPLVILNVPKAVDDSRLSETINKTIEKKIISLLLFDDKIEISEIDKAIDLFKAEFKAVKEQFPGSAARWEAKINGSVLFENDKILSIQLESYIFTGGAHGYGSTTFLNFDKKKGKQLKSDELFKDTKAFIAFAETKFREQEKIPLNVPINDTGFMFEEEVFTLSENIGFTNDGLQLLYNPYEVSSYADGQITVTLPYANVNQFLNIKVN